MQPVKGETVRAVCPHDCPDTCGMLVTVADGQAVRLRGDPDHPFTRGFLCQKVSRYLERVYHPDRLTHPLLRTGPKGAGQFRRISWDEANARQGQLRCRCHSCQARRGCIYRWPSHGSPYS